MLNRRSLGAALRSDEFTCVGSRGQVLRDLPEAVPAFQVYSFYVDCMFNVGWFGENIENLGKYSYNPKPMVKKKKDYHNLGTITSIIKTLITPMC